MKLADMYQKLIEAGISPSSQEGCIYSQASNLVYSRNSISYGIELRARRSMDSVDAELERRPEGDRKDRSN